jgi:hypothetical protein
MGNSDANRVIAAGGQKYLFDPQGRRYIDGPGGMWNVCRSRLWPGEMGQATPSRRPNWPITALGLRLRAIGGAGAKAGGEGAGRR